MSPIGPTRINPTYTLVDKRGLLRSQIQQQISDYPCLRTLPSRYLKESCIEMQRLKMPPLEESHCEEK